jgi:nitrogen fixation/metabolism regulation signal transduction histidine kinase
VRDKLFVPYFSTKQKGTGLGLAIVQRIISDHGGTIRLTDNTPRGTRVIIQLPVSPSAGQPTHQ